MIWFYFDKLKGQDATTAFEDIGHSASAYNLLENFYIGDLDLVNNFNFVFW